MTASARRSVFHGAVSWPSWSSWFPRAVPQTWTLVSDFGVHISPELKGPFPNSEILRSWSKVSGQTENTNRNRTEPKAPHLPSWEPESRPHSPFSLGDLRAPPLMARLPVRVSSSLIGSAHRLPRPGHTVVSSFIHLAHPRQESTSSHEHTL